MFPKDFIYFKFKLTRKRNYFYNVLQLFTYKRNRVNIMDWAILNIWKMINFIDMGLKSLKKDLY